MNLPEEFINKMQALLGQEYDEFIKSYDKDRFYGLRVNTLKISVDEFLKVSPFNLEPIPWTREGFYYGGEERPAKHPYYHAGLYYIQEPSAMAPGEYIDVKPGDRVLDLCAAPGGKSTQVAAKLQGKGLLVSNDISASRIKALVKNIELYGVKNCIITNETPQKLSQTFPNFFDKIIVDAPCSGEGMFRKDENAAKSWGVHSVEKCSLMQKDILFYASKMLRPGGYILYSTCTFSPEENECTIDRFISNNADFELVDIKKHSGIQSGNPEWCNNNRELKKCARFWPHKLDGEGHFLALLKKSNGIDGHLNYIRKPLDNKIIKPFYEFCEKYLDLQLVGDFELYGEYLHIIPSGAPSLNTLKVIRPGWFVGMLKKDRFEPSHALAMALKNDECKNKVNFDLDSKDLMKYLKGETLELDAEDGYNLVTVDGFPLGWAKYSGGILKNNYPAGWRIIE